MGLEYKDYYAILGVPRGATEEEIKKAFRRLARQHHPDVAKDKRVAEERFKEINEAYEVLGDPENRRKYDQLGENWRPGAEFRPPPGWQQRRARRGTTREAQEEFEFRFGGTGFSDFFENLFGGRGGGGRGFGFDPETGEGESGDAGIPAEDMQGDILVALDEVIHGSVRTISVQRVNPRDGSAERNSFQVRIPPGVREGQRIRVAGKGQPGSTGQVGDLYLRVRLARHPDFRVRDSDLITDLTVAPWEAVLGDTVKVPTLEGEVYLRVPPGSRNGQQLRLRTRGLPKAGGGRGDLYVNLAIDVPAPVTPEEKALWQQLAELAELRPRRPEHG